MQLYQVAKLINAQVIRGVQRDVFFIECMGFDHHADLNQCLDVSFTNMNAVLDIFWKEMKAQEIENKVVLVLYSQKMIYSVTKF